MTTVTKTRPSKYRTEFLQTPMKVGIGWRAVANRKWRLPAMNGKFLQHPERDGGGLGMQASRQAVGLGVTPVLFTATGDDEAGRNLVKELAETGADLQGVRITSGQTTQAEVITCNGSRAVLLDQSQPGIDWTPSVHDAQLMQNLDAICFGGTLSDRVVDWVLSTARHLGKTVFANPTRFQNTAGRNLQGVRMVQISRDDVRNFGLPSDVPAAAVAELFLGLGCDVAVVTESEAGERAFGQGGNSIWMPGVPNRIPSFPTGCGDAAFMAHIVGYLAGLSMYDWLNLGSLAGAFFVEHGYPGTFGDLNDLGKEWPPELRT